MNQHPVVEAAGRGELPHWAQISRKRRAHIERVAELIGRWAERSTPEEGIRWRAAARLHDCLRNADDAELFRLAGGQFGDWPIQLLHGPAAANRLRSAGVTDESLLNAITYHTLGHASLDRLGHALYMADFLEPGRTFAPGWRALLRARMPDQFADVLRAVVAARIEHQLHRGGMIRPETSGFWNHLVQP